MPVRFLLLAAMSLTGCGRIAFDDSAPYEHDPDLLAYWPLDEAPGATSFTDRSRFANRGSCTECPIAGVAGIRGTAIELPASPAAIQIASSATLAALTGPFTIAAWARVDARTQYGVIVSSDRDCCGTWSGYSLYAEHYESGPGLLTWAEGQAGLARGPDPLPLGEWHHVVGTFDRALLRVYVDGVLVSTANSQGIATPHSFDLWIGSLGYQAPTYNFTGAIDEVLILGRALGDDDVSAFYSEASPSGVRP